ncbi:MAG: hypothetical protein WBC44_21760 [Planctomycetaceae bacterium]
MMRVVMRRTILAAGAASAMLTAGLSAVGQSYFHAPAGGPPDYTTWGSRSSFYGSTYGTGYAPYVSPYATSYSVPFATPSPSYGTGFPGAGVMPYAASYGNPRGRLTYDVQTPYGSMEHNYRFRRNGTVDLDVDD